MRALTAGGVLSDSLLSALADHPADWRHACMLTQPLRVPPRQLPAAAATAATGSSPNVLRPVGQPGAGCTPPWLVMLLLVDAGHDAKS